MPRSSATTAARHLWPGCRSEYQICLAIAERRSNREIGQALFLSEGTVKQYVNQIYTKLHLTGAARDKRRLLGELVSRKN